MTVGRSSRTPFKHWVLDAHLGKIVGALSTRNAGIPAVANPFLCVDLCAGDGTETQEYSCSPRIITKHCEFLHKSGLPARSVFIEQSELTFQSLEGNINPDAFGHNVVLANNDAREFVVRPTCANQAIFVNCDPNSIADMPFSESLARSLTPTTTITLTLGCNVGGLKRMPKEQREEWFLYIKSMLSIMPSWHDAILIELIGDKSQWAYFTRLPDKWSSGQIAAIQKKGDGWFPKGVRVASWNRNRAEFQTIVNSLFLTRKEAANV